MPRSLPSSKARIRGEKRIREGNETDTSESRSGHFNPRMNYGDSPVPKRASKKGKKGK